MILTKIDKNPSDINLSKTTENQRFWVASASIVNYSGSFMWDYNYG